MFGYGVDLQTARRFEALSLGQFTANSTVTPAARFGCPLGVGAMRILGIHALGDAVPSDPDGTMILKALVNDVSEAADDTLVSQDLEGLIAAANRWYECTKQTEGTEDEFTLNPGDSLRFQLVNNSAGIATNANVTVMVEYILLPRRESEEDEAPNYVGYPSQY